jgi:hypothetical protein
MHDKNLCLIHWTTCISVVLTISIIDDIHIFELLLYGRTFAMHNWPQSAFTIECCFTDWYGGRKVELLGYLVVDIQARRISIDTFHGIHTNGIMEHCFLVLMPFYTFNATAEFVQIIEVKVLVTSTITTFT